MEIQHIISKKIDKRKYVAWFRVQEMFPDVQEIVFKFGIFGNKVRFATSELKIEDGSNFYLIQINGTSSVLHKFHSCSVSLINYVLVENLVVYNSKEYEDLTDNYTFEKPVQMLSKVVKKAKEN